MTRILPFVQFILMIEEQRQYSLSGVCERDIDLLLLEEFVSNTEFLHWFIQQVYPRALSSIEFIEAHRSVTQSNGESDLELTIDVGKPHRLRLLIENKVNASLQPMQAERYKARGTAYVEQGHCHEFRCVLAAPQRYFGSNNSTKGFDTTIPYETIKGWFNEHAQLGTRANYKAALLQAGIDKGVYGYQAVPNDAVSVFWREYWMVALEHAPELEMVQPQGKPAGASFIEFHPQTLPKGVVLLHKLSHGHADLQFSGFGNRLSELRKKYDANIESGMSFASAGKSGVIRIKVPLINVVHSFEDQKEDALSGLLAVQLLHTWFLSQGFS